VAPVASRRNPYQWDGDQPAHVVERVELLADVLASVEQGESSVLLGARGMGKSVFLARVQHALEARVDFDSFSFSAVPITRTVTGAVEEVARVLGRRVESRNGPGSYTKKLQEKLQGQAARQQLREVLETYIGELPAEVERLVFLYDEIDAYAEPRELGLYFFNELEDVRKKLNGQLVVVAAGGLGLLALNTVLGSSFFTRKTGRILEPFDADQLAQLAEPFSERGTPVSSQLLDDVRLASGGNVKLATYGFQRLWDIAMPTRRDVQDTYKTFQEHHSADLDVIWDAIFDLHVSEIPFHIWRALQRAGGTLPRAELERLRRETKTTLALSEKKIFDMLRASGLARMSTSVWGPGVDPIEVECIPSILALRLLDGEIVGRVSQQEQLCWDLQAVLVRIHSMTPAFRRPANKTSISGKAKKSAPTLVPEATFAAGLALGLEPRGWKCDLERMSGAGYPDITARHSRFGEDKAIVEVKIWPRNDYVDIHEQVTDYFADGVRAFATVMIRETKDAGWKGEYAKTCLEGKVDTHAWQELGPPLDGYFEARKGAHLVHHFLLGLPTRR
jgi:hypothetical protein